MWLKRPSKIKNGHRVASKLIFHLNNKQRLINYLKSFISCIDTLSHNSQIKSSKTYKWITTFKQVYKDSLPLYCAYSFIAVISVDTVLSTAPLAIDNNSKVSPSNKASSFWGKFVISLSVISVTVWTKLARITKDNK